MVFLLSLLNSNESAPGVMEILFLFRKIVLTQFHTPKTVPVTLAAEQIN